MEYKEEYNKALERAKKGMPIKEVFPELKESEDERIRKWLIEMIEEVRKANPTNAEHNGNCSEAIAYLEKQKEQDKCPEYCVRSNCIGCSIYEKQKEQKWSPSEGEMGVLYKLCYISNQITDEDDTKLTRLYQDLKREYFNGHSFENMFLNEKQKEQNPADISELMVHIEPYIAPVPTPIVADEQKPIEWSEDFEQNIRILLHDKLTWRSEDGSISSMVVIDDKTLKDIVNGIWFYVGKEANKYPNKELEVEQKPAEKSSKEEYMRKFKVGDVVSNGDDIYTIDYIGQDCYWLKEHDCATISFECEDMWYIVKNKQNPAEWSDLEHAIDWLIIMRDKYALTDEAKEDELKSLPERFNLQPKQEWGEEDKRKIVELKTFIAQCNGFNKENQKKAFDMIDTLYPQPHWKPSEEQMKILRKYVMGEWRDLTIGQDKLLTSLYNDLQKLL